jgi:hypothetical protein
LLLAEPLLPYSFRKTLSAYEGSTIPP